MPEERTGVVTLKGNPLTLLGPEIKVGDKAPDFKLNEGLGNLVTLGRAPWSRAAPWQFSSCPRGVRIGAGRPINFY